MKLIYGTTNPAKLTSMQERVRPLGITLVGLRDLDMPIPYVEETGNDPLENARVKVSAYYKSFNLPVFSCDSGLYFRNLPEKLQPGVHVRRIGGKTLNDDEMIEYYSSLGRRFENLRAYYRHAICLVVDEAHIYEAISPALESGDFILSSVPHKKRTPGFPLDSLSIEIQSGRYFCDISYEYSDYDGFSKFFRDLPVPLNSR